VRPSRRERFCKTRVGGRAWEKQGEHDGGHEKSSILEKRI